MRVPILVDADRSVYEAYGLLEGLPSQFYYDASQDLLDRDPGAGLALSEERRALGRPMVNSPWQLPGEFVIDGRGIVRLAYRYQYCEDFPDSRVLTAAIREATT